MADGEVDLNALVENIEGWDEDVEKFQASKQLYPKGTYIMCIEEMKSVASGETGELQVLWIINKPGDQPGEAKRFEKWDNVSRPDRRVFFFQSMDKLGIEIPQKLTLDWLNQIYEELKGQFAWVKVSHGKSKKTGKEYENLAFTRRANPKEIESTGSLF